MSKSTFERAVESLSSRADTHTPGPYIVRGEIEAGSPGYAMGVEPATDDAGAPRETGWPYFIREDREFPLGSGPLWLAHGIQRKADADLFAAAPDMLAALRIVLEQAAAMEKNAEMYRGWFGKVAAIAETAIAKAQGWPVSHCVDCGASLGRVSDRVVSLSCDLCEAGA